MIIKNKINPLQEIGTELQSIQNPARYLGGEFQQFIKVDADFSFGIAFPDLYEIAMSNQAIKIIYNGLNNLDGISCERVFAVEKDFENLLINKNIPLYTLETGIPLFDLDMLGFSIGYELGLTSVLSILDLGKIPLNAIDRDDRHPIVLAGGCGVTNPAPLAQFFDAVFIGEAENELFNLVKQISNLKKSGSNRKEILEFMYQHPSVWTKGKKTKRAIQNDFGKVSSVKAYRPLPSIKPVQDHGVVEIMRGCPNGCRFCHAGIYYRPQRMKELDVILKEVDELVNVAGYKEISLTSLSSGDYHDIEKLLHILTEKYKSKKISFQLPSLKVSSFTLPLLESLSTTRKSGLTFAVETPVESWQFSLNKEVYEEKLYDIIMNAKKRGWNKAKFYFMVGLPVGKHSEGHDYDIEGEYIVGGEGSEEKAIVDFMLAIQKGTGIQCNVNVGTFIPKPHTPYQWAAQLTQEQSREKLYYIRSNLPKGKFRVSTHNQFVSYIEGLISRGDHRVGEVVLLAYKKGCRLDAWEEHLNTELWMEAIKEIELKYNWVAEDYICKPRSLDDVLPWDDIDLGTAKAYYKSEWKRSIAEKRSPLCETDCLDHCGLCSKEKKGISVHTTRISDEDVKRVLDEIELTPNSNENELAEQNIDILWRAVFSFNKEYGIEYLPHLALVETFHKAFLRSNLPIMYTNGFNPLPRFELASSLSLGVRSKCEVASIILRNEVSVGDFTAKLQENLPSHLSIENVFIYAVSNKKKRESLASLLWGSRYTYTFLTDKKETLNFLHSNEIIKQLINRYNEKDNTLDVILPFNLDRPFRDTISTFFEKKIYECVDIEKAITYSKCLSNTTDYCTYFETYNKIAEIHKSLCS